MNCIFGPPSARKGCVWIRSIKSSLAASMWPQAPMYFSRPSAGSSVKNIIVLEPAIGCGASVSSATFMVPASLVE